MLAGTPTSDVMPPGAIYLSEDEGRTWRPIFSSDMGGNEMHFDVDSDGNIIVGFQILRPPFDSTRSAFWTSDQGVTWNQIGPWSIRINDLHRTPDEILLAATNRGIQRITDNGSVWSAAGLDTSDVLSLFSHESRMYAGTTTGLYVSEDKGTSWSVAGLPEEVHEIGLNSRGTLAVATSRGLYAQSGEGWAPAGLEGEILSFDASPELGDWAATSDGVFRHLEESGWVKVEIEASIVRTVRIFGSAVYAGTSYGLFRTDNSGETWNVIGMPDSKVHAVGLNADGHVLAGTESGLFISRDNALSWQPIRRDLWIDRIDTCPNGDIVIAAGYWGGVHRSSDGGTTWSWIGLPQLGIESIACTAQGIAAITARGVFRIESGQSNWTEANRGLEGANPTAVQAYGTSLFLSANTGFFRSDAADDSWTKLGDRYLDAIEVSSDGTIYGARGEYVYRSDDEGLTWMRLDVPSAGWILSLAAAPSGQVYFGTGGHGVFESKDRGETWQGIGAGLPDKFYRPASNISLTTIADLIVGATGHLYAGTSGHGVIRTLEPIATGSSHGRSDMNHVSLSAYPNPFSAHVTIELEVVQANRVQLALFDALGKRVADLVDEWLMPGMHRVTWSAEEAVSGIYFCRLIAGEVRATSRIVHIRGR